MLLLCTARPSLLEVWQRGLPGDVVELQPLSPEAIDEFIDGVLGGSGVDAAVRRRIAEAAEGNPLYAEQMLSMLLDEGVLRRGEDGWSVAGDVTDLPIPPTIHALLTARLDSLRPEERAVVDVASVIGQEFARDAVEELVPEAVRAEVEARLDSLAQKQLVRVRNGRDDHARTYRFGHILIRDAAYAGLLKRTRATLHEHFADWGERINEARQRGVEYEEILGFHLEQAHAYLSELGEPDDHQRQLAARAATKLEGAGRRAFAREDMPAAANLLRRAHDLLPGDAVARVEVVPDLAQALTQTGEFAWAEVFLREAVETAGRLGMGAIAAEARLAQLTTQRFVGGGEANWCEAVLKELESAVPILRITCVGMLESMAAMP